MGFLAPWFLLAGLSIALPILFHMIRKKPRGRISFSSIMFLSPSPPRLVRRSRVDDLLLLFLRALIVLLLAWAFARPFFRSHQMATDSDLARAHLILLDTSASMHEGDAWKQAQEHIHSILAAVGPGEVVALSTFDQVARERTSIVSSLRTSPEQRENLIRSTISSLTPTWHRTDLGAALVHALDQYSQLEAQADGSAASMVVHVVTDLQSGSNLRAVENLVWPDQFYVDLRIVRRGEGSHLYLSGLDTSLELESDASGRRILLTNERSSPSDQFFLEWRDRADQPVLPRIPVTLMPGQTKAVQVPEPSSSAVQLVVISDRRRFDDCYYVALTPPRRQTLIYVENPRDRDATETLGYFLEKMPMRIAGKDVVWQRRSIDDDSPWPSREECPLIVLTARGTKAIESLRQSIEAGTHVLWVLDHSLSSFTEQEDWMNRIATLSDAQVEIREGSTGDYALWTNVDFRHPLFESFSDPKYSDFTKIRFWKYRQFVLADGSPWRVLSTWDRGEAAFIEACVGAGKLWLLGSGFQPSQSQLALSTKFVPLLINMYERATPQNAWQNSATVGESIELPAGTQISVVASKVDWAPVSPWPGGKLTFEVPCLVEIRIPSQEPSPPSDQPSLEPQVSQELARVAVNIDLSESQLEPLDLGRLEQLGIPLGRQLSHQELLNQDRQKRIEELEQSQQLWRWLIVAIIVIALIETIIASRRRSGSGLESS